MSKKKIKAIVRLQIQAGKATPAPPVGTALGPHGLNIMEFTIYEDRSFTFVTKTPPAPDLLRQAAGIDKGSAVPNRDKVGKVTQAQLREIAEQKMPDLNAFDVDQAAKIIAGTARSMGVTVED